MKERKPIITSIISFIMLLIFSLISYFNIFGIDKQLKIVIYSLFCLNLVVLLFYVSKSLINIYQEKGDYRPKTGINLNLYKIFEDLDLYKILKIVIWMIPVIIILYIVYMNWLPFGGTIVDVVDVGDKKSEEVHDFTISLDRVSEPRVTNDYKISYRNLKDDLVYFNSKIPVGTKGNIIVKIKFKDNFPSDSVFLIGAKDQKEWHYNYNILYDKNLEDKIIYPPFNIPEDLPKTSLVYIDPYLDNSINNSEIRLENYQPNQLIINNSIRGPHTIIIYVKGDLNFQVFKQDLNWYVGEDKLNMELYKDNNLIKNVTIQDDGITDNSHKISNVQNKTLLVKNLKEGVYRIELVCDEDLIIKEIISNQDKLVFKNRLFLADLGIYVPSLTKTKKYKLYFKNYYDNIIKFKTYRDNPQKVKIFRYENDSKIDVEIKSRDIWHNATANPGFYSLKFLIGDIILFSDNYFSFTKNSYFNPNRFILINDYKKAEYIISNYKKPKKDLKGWLVAETNFNLRWVYIENNRLNFLLNARHLMKEEYKENTIPIDWVEVYIQK